MVPAQSISKASPTPNPVCLPWQIKAVSVSAYAGDPAWGGERGACSLAEVLVPGGMSK